MYSHFSYRIISMREFFFFFFVVIVLGPQIRGIFIVPLNLITDRYLENN